MEKLEVARFYRVAHTNLIGAKTGYSILTIHNLEMVFNVISIARSILVLRV